MSLEQWNTVLQFSSALLLGLTFAVGAGAIFTGYLIGKRQDERLAVTERDAAEANKQAALAGQGTASALAQAAAANERAAGLEAKAAQLQLDLDVQGGADVGMPQHGLYGRISILVAALNMPAIVAASVKQALTPDGTGDRNMLFQHAGFLPTPRGKQLTK